jgi:hypothetical protein
VAVPCARHRHPGLAARRGGGKVTAAAGCGSGVSGSCTKRTARRPEGKGGPTVSTEGSSAAHGSRQHHGERKGAAAAILTGGAEGRRAWCGGGSEPVG